MISLEQLKLETSNFFYSYSPGGGLALGLQTDPGMSMVTVMF